MSVAETPHNPQAQDAEESAHQPSVFANLAGVFEDHVNLLALEAEYEMGQARRRLLAAAIGMLLGLAAFLLGQVAIVDGLVALFKIPVWAACLLLMVVYGSIAAYIVKRYALRDRKAGRPFAGTRRELIGTLQWIQKLFS